MKDLAEQVLNKLPKVDYADVRVVRVENENLATKDGVVEALESSETYGFGIRVLYKGSWGFAASDNFDKKNILRVVERALDIARSSNIVKGKKVILDKQKPIRATYKTPVGVEPLKVPLSKKINYLLKVDKAQKVSPKIKISQTYMRTYHEEKTFASTEGSKIDQEITWCGGGFEATAIDEHDLQARTFPNSFRGQFKTGGYEVFENLKLLENAPGVAREAVELLFAPQCPSGEFDLILDGNQLGLQIHESCGHATELDRVLGYEASFAGTSFLTLDKLGSFRYGSDIVNLTADATLPGGIATFGFDDEGVPAKRQELVKNGILVGYMTSRETAPIIKQVSNGTARADGWSRIPLIRMTNVNLEPGAWEFDDLIADTKDGILMSTNKSWSIDDRRLNFQFGTEIAWEIKNGKKGKILKNPTYTGITPNFWGSCDAICSKKYWEIWGTPNCGKGQPEQVMFTGHGASPSRFKKVQVGVGKW